MEAIVNEQPATLAPAKSVSTGTDILVPYNQLFPGNDNMRTVMAKEADAGIIELAELIHSQGLLHRLSVTNEGTEGYGVQAGGRRLKALGYNVQKGRLAEDALIPCAEYAKERGTEVSLAENSGRLESHPVDQFMAFAKLRDEGRTNDQIASRFGVSLLTVERRMVLSKIAPRFLQLCRSGVASMDQLQALALTTDHDQQIAAWDSLSEYNRTPHMLRRQLTSEEVEASNRCARFVGIDAYTAAGGAVRRDLFSEQDQCFFQDGALLNRLAMEKLETFAQDVRAEGWLWVEVHEDLGDSCFYDCEREHARHVKLSETEQEGSKAVEALLEGLLQFSSDLEERLDTGDFADDEAKGALQDAFEAAAQDEEEIRDLLSAMEDAMTYWAPKQLATCGVIVALNHRGDVDIRRGLQRPEDRKAMVAELQKAGKAIPANLRSAVKAPAERAAFSERLMHDMTAHKTAAMQAALIEAPHVALALMVHKMARAIFTSGYHPSMSPLKVSCSLTRHTPLNTRATDYAESPAAIALERAEERWGDFLPSGDGAASTLPWFLKQEDHVLLELLAFCTASSLDAMHGRERSGYDDSDALAEGLDLDMADWWQATPEKYLSNVSKAQLIEAVTEACDAETAKPMATMKKGDAVTYCFAKLEGKNWLPAPLRRKTNP